jgi:hypothetical protein
MRPTLLLALCLTFTATPAFAGYGGGGLRMSGGGSSSSGNSSSSNTPPPVDRSASIKARKDVNAATAEVNKAINAQNGIVARLRLDFERTADWKSAQSNLKSAQSDYDAARRTALAALADQPAYRSAHAARQHAEVDREALRANSSAATEDQRLRIAKSAFDAAQALSKLESDALAADPTAKSASAKVTTAKSAIADLLKTFEASCADNADWQAAQKVIDEKKEALAAAQKTLADAVAQEAQAERERQKQIAASH